jgi:hypothetical protein
VSYQTKHYVSNIVNSFYHFDNESRSDFESSVIEFIISKYGIEFVVDILADREFKMRHPVGQKTDAFYRKYLQEKKVEIKLEVESELKKYIREQKLNKIL